MLSQRHEDGKLPGREALHDVPALLESPGKSLVVPDESGHWSRVQVHHFGIPGKLFIHVVDVMSGVDDQVPGVSRRRIHGYFVPSLSRLDSVPLEPLIG